MFVQNEKDKVVVEVNQLRAQNQSLVTERDQLALEKDALNAEIARLKRNLTISQVRLPVSRSAFNVLCCLFVMIVFSTAATSTTISTAKCCSCSSPSANTTTIAKPRQDHYSQEAVCSMHASADVGVAT